MTEYTHAIIIIAVMGGVTLATRVLPVLVFGRSEKIPEFILYLGKVIPYTAMGLLIVYCLRDVSVLHGSHGLPELIAMRHYRSSAVHVPAAGGILMGVEQ